MGYYNSEFENNSRKFFDGAYLIALELKNIANELHESNQIMLNTIPSHLKLGANGATIYYECEKGATCED